MPRYEIRGTMTKEVVVFVAAGSVEQAVRLAEDDSWDDLVELGGWEAFSAAGGAVFTDDDGETSEPADDRALDPGEGALRLFRQRVDDKRDPSDA